MASQIAPFSSQHLEAACRVLADTSQGLNGTQIGRLLQDIQVADSSPDMTKWKRLFKALASAQNQHQVGNHLIMFTNRAMNPVSYASDSGTFSWHRDELNVVLAFSGFYVREDGKVGYADKVNISESEKSEQKGFANLLVGLFGAVRNPLAHHTAKTNWPMSEQDALDILTLVSLIHRKLDGVTRRAAVPA